jgi:hypothetical protein
MGVSTQEGAVIVTASSRGNVETKCGMTLELANVNGHENFRTSTAVEPGLNETSVPIKKKGVRHSARRLFGHEAGQILSENFPLR